MYQPPGKITPTSWASRAPLRSVGRVAPDIFSPLLTVALPRGKMDIRLRVAAYANGSRALELRDSDDRPFYSPTLPCCPVTLATLVSPEDAAGIVLAIKPSALRNGMAGALQDAELLIDLGIEMPVDRHWVRLMRLNLPAIDAAAAEPEIEARQVVLKPPEVPLPWKASCRRIQLAFGRHGKTVSEADAMLAWAQATRAMRHAPEPLPASGDDIHDRLRGYFSP